MTTKKAKPVEPERVEVATFLRKPLVIEAQEVLKTEDGICHCCGQPFDAKAVACACCGNPKR